MDQLNLSNTYHNIEREVEVLFPKIAKQDKRHTKVDKPFMFFLIIGTCKLGINHIQQTRLGEQTLPF